MDRFLLVFFKGIVTVFPNVAWLVTLPKPESTSYALLMLLFAGISIVIPYLLGSINPAVLISRLVFRDDVRNHGSGNAGTTNMLRTFGKGAAIATFLLDLGKAALSYLIGAFFFGVTGAALAGFFVVFGHMFPIFSHFRGGKGVACLTMVALMTSPITALILIGIFAVIVASLRMVSLGSIMCALLYPLILSAFAGDLPFIVAMAILSAVFVVFMHRENVKRIMNGSENKLDFSKLKKKKKEDDK